MDSKQREELYKITEEIAEKYKDKPFIYARFKKIIRELEHARYVGYRTYSELANLTSKIDYGCEFKDGKCKSGRTEMCCCANCGNYTGYLSTKFFNLHNTKDFIEKELLFYVKRFRIKNGFWRKGKGCILPRERRSATCLNYNCMARLTKHEKLLFSILYTFKHTEHQPRYIHEITDILKDYFLYRDE